MLRLVTGPKRTGPEVRTGIMVDGMMERVIQEEFMPGVKEFERSANRLLSYTTAKDHCMMAVGKYLELLDRPSLKELSFFPELRYWIYNSILFGLQGFSHSIVVECFPVLSEERKKEMAFFNEKFREYALKAKEHSSTDRHRTELCQLCMAMGVTPP